MATVCSLVFQHVRWLACSPSSEQQPGSFCDYLVVYQFQPSCVKHFTGWAILNVSHINSACWRTIVSSPSCTRALVTFLHSILESVSLDDHGYALLATINCMYPGQEQWHLVWGLSHPRVQHPGTHWRLHFAIQRWPLTCSGGSWKHELFVVWFDCRRARLCDDISLIVRFEMSVIIMIIIKANDVDVIPNRKERVARSNTLRYEDDVIIRAWI